MTPRTGDTSYELVPPCEEDLLVICATGRRWILLNNGNAELRYFFIIIAWKMVEPGVELAAIWDAMTLMWRHYNDISNKSRTSLYAIGYFTSIANSRRWN